MPGLKVIARGTKAKGKAAVYFSCHPDDRDTYLSEIASEILGHQDCAIYYSGDGQVSDDELSEMKLIVSLVTENFLYGDCRAKIFEYGFALEKHIPLLPIVAEPGLAEVFGGVMEAVSPGYGRVQFLDRCQDDTAIPYDEKLEAFLSSVILGGGQKKRVREAFSGSLFVSYRKKDRLQAKKLMSVISEVPEAWDTAVWYDEFLIPGEDWDDTLKDAMARCSAVIIAVTRSIAEPGNFVSRIEYPEAIKTGKAVIPVLIENPGSDALSEAFPGMPPLVDLEDKDAIRKSLLPYLKPPLLKGQAVREKQYLIGLARLYGTDSERDYDKAIPLIEKAAVKGLPEAMEKMAEIYRLGIGAEKNTEKELYWLRERADAAETSKRRRKGSYKTGDEKKRLQMEVYRAYMNYGDALDNLYRYDEALTAYSKMLEAAEALSSKSAKKDQSRALRKIGGACRGLGRLEDAGTYFKRAVRIDEEIVRNKKDKGMLRSLAASLRNSGNTAYSAGKAEEALDFYQKSVKICEELCGRDGISSDLARSYGRMGFCLYGMSRLPEAEGWYIKACDMYRRISEEKGSKASAWDYAGSLENLADLYVGSGKLTEAEELFLKSLSIKKADAAKMSMPSGIRSAGYIYRRLGNISEKRIEYAAARRYYEKCISLWESNLGDSGVPEDMNRFAAIYADLASLSEKEKRDKEAESWREKALSSARLYALDTESLDGKRKLAGIYETLGNAEKSDKNPVTAYKWYRDAVMLREEVCSKSDRPFDKRNHAIACRKAGDCLRGEPARKWYEKGMASLEESKSIPDYKALARLYSSMRESLSDDGNDIEVRKWLLMELPLRESICRDEPSDSTSYELSMVYYKLAETCQRLGEDFAEEKSAYEKKCLEISEKSEKKPSAAILAFISFRQADEANNKGDKEEALKLYETAYEKYREANLKRKNHASFYNMALLSLIAFHVNFGIKKKPEPEWMLKAIGAGIECAVEYDAPGDWSLVRFFSVIDRFYRTKVSEEFSEKLNAGELSAMAEKAASSMSAMDMEGLCLIYEKAGTACLLSGNLDAALLWLGKSLTLRDTAKDEEPTAGNLAMAADLHYHYGSILKMKKRRKEAVGNLKTSLGIYEQMLTDGMPIPPGSRIQLGYCPDMLMKSCGITSGISIMTDAFRDYPKTMDEWSSTYGEKSIISWINRQIKSINAN